MADYKCALNWLNKTEWLQHVRNILKYTKDDIISNTVLDDICDFNFKFETILQ